MKRQQKDTAELCKKHKLTLDQSLTLRDLGKSAYHGKHLKAGGALRAFLDAVESGRVLPGSWLVLESLDRFDRRKPRLMMPILLELVNSGITIATAKPERIYDAKSADENPFELMEILMIASRANEESETKSKRVKEEYAKVLQDAAEGKRLIDRRPPSWLEVVNGKFVVIEERQKLVEEIFSMANTIGARAIAKDLNRRKIKTWGKGKAWGWAHIQQILNDGKVLGILTSSTGITIKNYYPRIISDRDFEAIKSVTKKRTNWRGRIGTKVANLFQGIAYDVETGSTMVTVKKRKDTPYRFTPSAYETGKAEDAKSFPYELVEQEFLRFTKELSTADVSSKKIQPDNSQSIERELSQVENRLEELSTLLETGDIPEVMKAITSLRSKKQALAQKLQDAKAKANGQDISSLSATQSIIEALKKATGSDLVEKRLALRAAIRDLVERIDCSIIRDGWIYVFRAEVTFKTGAKRRIAIATERGILIYSAADSIAWKKKPLKAVLDVGLRRLDKVRHILRTLLKGKTR